MEIRCEGAEGFDSTQASLLNPLATSIRDAGYGFLQGNGTFVLRPLAAGGSGYIYTLIESVSQDHVVPASYCIKLLKPDRAANKRDEFGQESALLDIMATIESEPLSVKVLRTTDKRLVVALDEPNTLFFLMERGITLNRLLKSTTPHPKADEWEKAFHKRFWREREETVPTLGPELVQMLRDLDASLAQLHFEKRDLVTERNNVGFHLDIKAENIAVVSDYHEKTGHAPFRYRLIDFGSFTNRAQWDAANAEFETTHDTLPDELRRKIDLREATSDKRVRVSCRCAGEMGIPPDGIDRHQLGRVVVDILESDSPYSDVRKHLSQQDRELLLELATCLLHSDDKSDVARIGQHLRIADIAGRIENASLLVERGFGRGFVQLPGTSLRTFDEPFQNLIRQPLFKRLSGLLQLGLTYKVYPGATHSRYEHSLGTFQVAVDYLQSLLSKSGSRWLAARINADQAKLCALHALLHDIGQYPFAHYVEDVGLFPKHSDLTEWVLTENLESLGLSCPGTVEHCPCGSAHHPGRCPARLVDREDLESLHGALWTGYSVRPKHWQDWFKAIRDAGSKPRNCQNGVAFALSQIVDGPLDADKFDYVRRDAAHCGFKAIGGIERDAFLESLVVCHAAVGVPMVERYVLGLRESALCALEQLSLARYHLYTLVYWNASCRAYTALLRDAVVRRLDGFLSDRNYSGLWKWVGEWCRNKSEENVVTNLLGQDANRSVKTLVDDVVADRPPVLIAELDMARPAPFHAMRRIAHRPSSLDSSVPLPPHLKDHQTGVAYRRGGLELVTATETIVKTELPGTNGEDIVIDVPMQNVDKSNEVARAGVVRDSGEVFPPGPIWDAISPAIKCWPQRIRVMRRGPMPDPMAAKRVQKKLEALFR